MVTLPSTRAPETTSCMRFRHRTKVDFPHPEGPMTAVTCPRAMARVMPLSAWEGPNQAFRFWVAISVGGGSTAP
jgi:hypothetical protein